MTYQIELSNAAERQLKKLPMEAKALVAATIEGLAIEPRPSGVVKLVGDEQAYRIRVRNYRIVYEIDDSGLIVVILKVGHRRDVYR